jgi:hypothetical protein
MLAGRSGTGAAALILGWASEASYSFIALEPGRPVTLEAVGPGSAGQPVVSAVPGCAGAPLDDGELPDGPLAPLQVSARAGIVDVSTPARHLLRCAAPIARGQVGVGALHGTVRFDDLSVGR